MFSIAPGLRLWGLFFVDNIRIIVYTITVSPKRVSGLKTMIELDRIEKAETFYKVSAFFLCLELPRNFFEKI